MAAQKFDGYTEDQINDARKILDVYERVPDEKKPVFMAMMNGFMNGMEMQERISGVTSKR